jgi:hypothetical protein
MKINNMNSKIEEEKAIRLTAVILKQIYELKQTMQGKVFTDIPVEAFMPDRKEEIL